MKPVVRRLFCVAGDELACRIPQICKRTAGIDAGEIELINPKRLSLLNADCPEESDVSRFFRESLNRSLDSDPASVIAVIIDATSEFKAISKWLCESPETVWGMVHRAFQHSQESTSVLRSLEQESSDSTALRLLALAGLVSKSGCLSLICLSRLDFGDQTEAERTLQALQKVVLPPGRGALGFRFVVENSPELALDTAVRSVNALQCVGGKEFSTPSSSRHVSLVLEPLQHYEEQWEAEEFEEDEVIEAVRAKVVEFPNGNLLSNAREVLLRSATLARLLATRSFEHHGCNATIVLADKDGFSDLTGKAACPLSREIFNFQTNSRSTWFHLADPWLREDGIETALSSRSVLLVDILTGRILGVWELNSQSDTRFEMLNRLTTGTQSGKVIVLAALESGYVEIHHRGSLAFWYDRNRWRHDPFGQMQRRILKAGVLPTDSEENLEKICGAISILMDAQESSILVFIRDAQLQGLSPLLKPMRQELVLRQERVLSQDTADGTASADAQTANEIRLRAVLCGGQLKELSARTLASIFRLDGAHIIADGRIVRFAERIVLPSESEQSSENGSGGTGRTAARWVAAHVPGSVVVKVSSSGGLRMYFQSAAR